MKKILPILAIVVLMLTACGQTTVEDTESNLTIRKDKSIVSDIREDFGQNYYDINELNAMIKTETDKYNKSHPNAISFENAVLNENSVKLIMTFGSSDDYSSFNNEKLFVGNSPDAILKGYNLDVILTDVNDATKTIAGVDIRSMTDDTIIIADYPGNIHLPSDALYISDNVTVTDKGRTIRKKDMSAGPIYIIY
ncbi:MAG: hypothetical protein K5870_02185 [Lachnospiraceae bacterium]|nr:hypothetical protein [Lachnospiraceae bacterium]